MTVPNSKGFDNDGNEIMFQDNTSPAEIKKEIDNLRDVSFASLMAKAP